MISRYRSFKFWNNVWSVYKNFNYAGFSFIEKLFYNYIGSFFRLTKIISGSLFFGNLKVFRTPVCVHINVFLYDNLVNSKILNKNLIKSNFPNEIFLKWGFIIKMFLNIPFYNNDYFEFIELFFDPVEVKVFLTKFYFYYFFLFKEVKKNSVNSFVKNSFLTFINRENYLGNTSIFNSFYVPLDEVEISNVPFKVKKDERFNLKNVLYFLSKVSTQFFKDNCNVRLIKISSKTASALFFCNLLSQKIIKLGRPRSRQNKLTKRFFLSFINKIRKDKLVSGLKIILAGRINRRGRAMWKQYSFGKIPFGTFNLGVDFAKQSIKTVNGILTIKLMIFRHKNIQASYEDFLTIKPNLLLTEFLFNKGIRSFSDSFLLEKKLDVMKKMKKVSDKRQLKKLKKSSFVKEHFFIIN